MTPKAGSDLAIDAATWGLLLLLGLLWGGSFFFGRVAVQELPPLTLVFFRVSIAAAALLLVVRTRGLSLQPVRAAAGAFLVLGLLNNIVPFGLIFLGQTEIGSGLASIVNATTPFWTALLASRLTTQESVGPRKFLGILIGIVGVAVLLAPKVADLSSVPAWPLIAVLGATVSYAFASIFAKRFSGTSPVVIATGQLCASFMMALPLMLVVHGVPTLAAVSLGVWLAVLALAIVSTAFAYILYFSIIARAGATNASLVTLVVPPFAILLGTVFLGERLSSYEVAGMAVIMLGLTVIDGRVFRRSAKPS